MGGSGDPARGAVVAAAIRGVVDPIVDRYWRALQVNEVVDKGAGQLTTPADQAIESGLCEALARIEPGRIVAEERSPEVQAVPAGTRWVIDPLDGTRQFVAGSVRFAVAVALLDGQFVSDSWVYAPRERGMVSTQSIPMTRRGRKTVRADDPVWVTAAEFRTRLGDRYRDRLLQLGVVVKDCDCAALAYCDLLAGRARAAVFDWAKVWDHAPGIGLCLASGGMAVDGTGQPWNPYSEPALPLVVTATAGADELRSLLDDLPN